MDKGDEGKGIIKNNSKGFVCIYLFAWKNRIKMGAIPEKEYAWRK